MTESLEPFFIESGVTTKEGLDQIRARAVKEMMAKDFCGTAFFLTTWGEKPE